MKLKIRRVGNSLGVLLPKDVLIGWGLGEGDTLELGLGSIRPSRRARPAAQALDELGLSIGLAVVRQFTAREIRAQIRATLSERRRQGDWTAVCDEWQALARGRDEGRLYAAMLGRDERARSLRQILPFIDLLAPAQVRALKEGTAA
jgi:hypothetical protein